MLRLGLEQCPLVGLDLGRSLSCGTGSQRPQRWCAWPTQRLTGGLGLTRGQGRAAERGLQVGKLPAASVTTCQGWAGAEGAGAGDHGPGCRVPAEGGG